MAQLRPSVLPCSPFLTSRRDSNLQSSQPRRPSLTHTHTHNHLFSSHKRSILGTINAAVEAPRNKNLAPNLQLHLPRARKPVLRAASYCLLKMLTTSRQTLPRVWHRSAKLCFPGEGKDQTANWDSTASRRGYHFDLSGHD